MKIILVHDGEGGNFFESTCYRTFNPSINIKHEVHFLQKVVSELIFYYIVAVVMSRIITLTLLITCYRNHW